jgi:hypothetical protein
MPFGGTTKGMKTRGYGGRRDMGRSGGMPSEAASAFTDPMGLIRLQEVSGIGSSGRDSTQALMPPMPIESLPATPREAGQGASKT